MIKQILHKIFGHRDATIHGIRPGNLPRTIRFYVKTRTENFRVLKLGGEEEYLERFINELQPSDIVWDVGASIGLYGISAAVTACEGEVYSFEPDPQIAGRLQENRELNQLDNLHVVECAVSDEPGEVTLFTNGIQGFSPTLRKQSSPGAASGEVLVKAETLDQLRETERIPTPTVVKIDIEGAEFQALKGMQKTLQLQNRPRVIFLELHPEFLKSFGATERDCESLLEEAGYTIDYRVDRNNETLLILRADQN